MIVTGDDGARPLARITLDREGHEVDGAEALATQTNVMVIHVAMRVVDQLAALAHRDTPAAVVFGARIGPQQPQLGIQRRERLQARIDELVRADA